MPDDAPPPPPARRGRIDTHGHLLPGIDDGSRTIDESKRVDRLGQKSPLPVEVTPFALPAHERFLRALGATPTLRAGDGGPYLTDNGNYILDCRFADGIGDARGLAVALAAQAGIVEHGLFLGLASSVIVAGADGVHTIDRPGGTPSPKIG